MLLQNCDGTEIQGAKFNPRNSSDGTVVWYGAGIYDWYAPGGNNENVKKLTENTLLYLADKESLLATKEIKGVKVSIFPNPVSSVLNIEAAHQVSSEIYDMSGRIVIISDSKSIDVEKLVPGNYSIKIKEGSSFKILKFIKR